MASETERRRLFFALWPDDALRGTLYKETRRAVRASGGKPVAKTNFHITLAFLGQLDRAGAQTACAAGEASRGELFDLVLDRFGFWPEAGVVWLGPAQVPEAGSRFAEELRRQLRARGIKVDVRPFAPHLTLARKVAKPGDFGTPHPLRWPVREFVLVHSVTAQRASEYHLLATWPLRAAAVEL
ncbi:MAG: RNA 2',3'-cyclic phosphodiesterase [Gammaproteobacteria bacterium]